MKVKSREKPVIDAACAMLAGIYPQCDPKELYRRLASLDEAPEVKPQKPNADPRGYSPAEAAHMLSVSRRTVFRHIHDGRLQAAKIGPRLVRIPREELDKMLATEHCFRPAGLAESNAQASS